MQCCHPCSSSSFLACRLAQVMMLVSGLDGSPSPKIRTAPPSIMYLQDLSFRLQPRPAQQLLLCKYSTHCSTQCGFLSKQVGAFSTLLTHSLRLPMLPLESVHIHRHNSEGRARTKVPPMTPTCASDLVAEEFRQTGNRFGLSASLDRRNCLLNDLLSV